MSIIKVNCRPVIPCKLEHRLAKCFKPEEHHPSYLLALEALDDYCHWVEEAVMPIACAWIEEHKDAVYAKVPPPYTDDIAVVIAAAFQIIRTYPFYKKGVELGNDHPTLESVKAAATYEINPVWAAITCRNALRVEQDWNRYRDLLDDTIHWENPCPDKSPGPGEDSCLDEDKKAE
jgi:hypothetical protein